MRHLSLPLLLLAGLAAGCSPTEEGPTEAPPERTPPPVDPVPDDVESGWDGLPPHLDHHPTLPHVMEDGSKRPDRPFGPVDPEDPPPEHFGLTPMAPTRLAISDTGLVFFTDTQQGAIMGYDDEDKVLELAGLDKPLGLEVLGDTLYVSSGEDGSVRLYDLVTEQFVGALGQGPGEFAMPNDLAITPDGSRIYVVDSLDNAVRYYDPAGPRLGRWGARGTGNGQFHFPAAVVTDGTRVWVADQGNHRVQVFSLDGAYQSSFGSMLSQSVGSWEEMVGKFTRPQGLAVLPGPEIAVLDSMYGHVQLFDAAGTALGFIGERGTCPTCPDLALDVEAHPDGTLYVTDTERGRWIRLSRNTRRAP